jgi:hypothetical protein
MADIDFEEFTEDMVVGAWAESQYKRENIPGYNDAFMRTFRLFQSVMDVDDPPQQQREELWRAMAELFMLELTYQQRKRT